MFLFSVIYWIDNQQKMDEITLTNLSYNQMAAVLSLLKGINPITKEEKH